MVYIELIVAINCEFYFCLEYVLLGGMQKQCKQLVLLNNIFFNPNITEYFRFFSISRNINLIYNSRNISGKLI